VQRAVLRGQHYETADMRPPLAMSLLVALARCGDLLLCAKHLFSAARTRQSSTKDRAGSVRRVMVVAGREDLPGPRR
jgi:hypothetical protein